ncbi:YbaK/EbsC family protein [Kitasatospora sp. NPDC089913]|uniref:YbaK/EbsC family protein n=1 Tax=Kitasatospora sp. NPDC089913 TaxID=3364080 RepID=UPI0037F41859
MTMMSSSGTPFRLIDHRPEGRTAEASALRGHALRQAAKCVVVRTRTAGSPPRHTVVVVPGDRRVDLEAVAHHLGGDRTAFADRRTAERLTRCRSGSIVPFTFHPELGLLADPTLLEPAEIYFNAARLDRSLAIAPADWAGLAHPLIRPVAQHDPVAVG